MLASVETIWNMKCLWKVRAFSWLLTKEEILTWNNLQRKGWAELGICMLCKANDGSMDHLFFCAFAANLWNKCAYTYSVAIRLTKMDNIWTRRVRGDKVLELPKWHLCVGTYREKEIKKYSKTLKLHTP